MKIRPRRLQPGDTVALVALSSGMKPSQLDVKLRLLERLGLQYKIGKTVYMPEGMLAGTEEERLFDLTHFVKDPDVKAIFCVRGGYGIARMIDKIDYMLIEENPKIIVGFSDVTVLHTAVNEFSNLVTFHGPMLSDGEEPLDELSMKMYQQLFMPIEIVYSEAISPLQTIVGGTVRGELTGGNLNRFVGTLGTKFEIDVCDKILVIEDVGESVQRIDHMLNHLRLARKLEQAAGFVIGDFTGMKEGETYEDVVETIKSYVGHLNKPVVAGFKIGHCIPNIMVPFGVDALLDADQKTLRILPGVE